MKTKEVEEKLGLTKYTLRYYEKEGLIHPDKDENGYRNYDEEDIQVLHLIKFLRNINISMDDVKGILCGELSFQECLRVNKIHLDNEIKHLQEVQKTMTAYNEKNIPLIPALAQVKAIESKGIGLRKVNKEITLGKKASRWTALRKWIFAFVVSYVFNIIWILIALSIEDIHIKLMFILVLVLPLFVFTHFVLYGLNIQFSAIEHSLNQSVEFLNEGLRYYKRKGIVDHNYYLYATMLNKQDKVLKYCKYEDIEKVILKVNKRYMKLGTPISSELYIVDFIFEFKDGSSFYFYWPSTYNNDMQAIAIILDEYVKNIEDEKHILPILKQGIRLEEYYGIKK